MVRPAYFLVREGKMKNLMVGQSGGPSAVINASLAGVVAGSQKNEAIGQVYGMIYGIEGLLQDQSMEMTSFSEEELSILATTPGAYLGSCRFRLPADPADPIYDQIFQKLEAKNIGYFLYIGGNDSMDTLAKLSRQAKARKSEIVFLGIPKTVDNDLVLTDHTPGFGSAAKYVAHSVRNVVADTDAYDMKSVTIMEIMGRHAGWLTGASVLARRFEGDNPALIYLPEVPFVEADFIGAVKQELEGRNSLVICVSEGICDPRGNFLCEGGASKLEDQFGHKLLSGAAAVLEELVAEKVGVKVRSFNLGLSQRCASQSLSKTDVDEAREAGRFAVDQASQGQSGKMVSFHRKPGEYGIEYGLAPVDLICNREKTIPLAWIKPNQVDLGPEFIGYVRPLIQGEVYPPSRDGLPVFLTRQRQGKENKEG